MSELYKTNRKAFTAWNYQAEVEELNRMSEQGWQLIKGKLFSQKYKKNDNIVYKYQLDYQPKIEDLGRYIATFSEQGWEYVNSTFNGWHYFRKVYDPSLPPETYEIYTDENSLKEMNNKWMRLGALSAILLGLEAILIGFMLAESFRISSAILFVAIVAEFFWLGFGVLSMRSKSKKRKAFNARYFLAFFFGILLIYFLVNSARFDFNVTTKADYYAPIEKTHPVKWDEEVVTYPDFYSLEVEGKIAAPLSFEIINTKTNTVVMEDTLVPDSNKNISFEKNNIFLKKGTYSINFTNFAGGMVDFKFDLD